MVPFLYGREKHNRVRAPPLSFQDGLCQKLDQNIRHEYVNALFSQTCGVLDGDTA